MKAGGEAGRSPRRSSRYPVRPCYDVRGTCVHVALPRHGRFSVQVTQTGAARETGSEQEVTGEKNSRHVRVHGVCVHVVCVCVHGVYVCMCVHVWCECAWVCVCTWCACAWCVCVHGVCVHVWCVCSWCAHVCGCVCVQREWYPVTLANTAHTWARAVMSHPGHRMWSAVTRLRPHGLCGRVYGESLWRGCETGPSEVTRLVTAGKQKSLDPREKGVIGKQKSLDPQEKGARVHCTVASTVV